MTEVGFLSPEEVSDAALRYVVIVARHGDKYVFCRHRARSTWEIPGGKREKGEMPEAAARRELHEETGALRFTLLPVCVYAVYTDNLPPSYGMLYTATLFDMEDSLRAELQQQHSEIADICFTGTPPEHWTYPDIQPLLLSYVSMLPVSGDYRVIHEQSFSNH